jgi:uncharacterized membrane protein YgcG
VRRLGALILAAAFLLAAGAAHADERILSFLSDAHVMKDGDLAVTETIRVEAEGRTIRHGIFRDFPTDYRDAHGGRVRVGFTVLSVERDGHKEPYATEAIGGGVRVRIGDANTLVPTGQHRYVIAYRTSRQIGFFPDYDELYWNATGTGWSLPIDVVVAQIVLPEAVPFLHWAIYTGPQGGHGQDARVVQQSAGRIVFRTTKPLQTFNGLTVAASWKKGVVTPPTGAERTGRWLRDNLVPLVAIVGLVPVLAYYLYAWLRVGRGPRAGTMVPLFEPPDGLSPAAVRYVSDMGFDDRTYTAGILDLAVHGRLRLRDLANHITQIEAVDGGKPVDAAEEALRAALFAKGTTVALEQSNHQTLSSARAALEKGLDAAYSAKKFQTNLRWSLIGGGLCVLLLLLIVGAASIAYAGALHDDAMAGILLPMVGAAIGAGMVAGAVMGAGGSRWFLVFFGLVFGGIFATVGTMVAASTIGRLAEYSTLAVAIVLAVVAVSAFTWMKAPTREGRALMDKIAGFRRYLGVAEERRLEALNPPEKTPQLFERFLPYAIALGVENHWAERFAGVLAAAAAAGATSPVWYPNHVGGFSNPTAFASQLGSGLTSTVSSASAAPGSSSGSGGGGSSGGGGGGGGGGGW